MTTATIANTVVVPVYRAEKNADGTWNVFDVPVMAETKKRLRDGTTFQFTPAWMRAAVMRSQADAQKGYLGTLKMRHVGDAKPPEFAGHFLLTRVEPMDVPRLGLVQVVRANYLSVPDAVYRLMAGGLLPGVSIESMDVTEGLIDAVSLLDRDTPHIPFPLFRVPSAEAPPECFEKWDVDNPGAGGPVTLFKHGNQVALLSRFPMADDPKPAEKPEEKKGGEGKDGGSDVDKLVALVMKSPDLEKAVRAQVETMLSTIAGGGGGSKSDGPHDVTAAKAEADKAVQMATEAGKKSVELQARLDTLEGKEKSREQDAALVKEVDATLARLSKFHLGDGAREALLTNARSVGVGACKLYEDTVRKFGTEAPAGIDPAAMLAIDPAGGKSTADLPPEVMSYAGTPNLEKAVKASREFDTLRGMGRLKDVTRETHVKLAVEGIQALCAAK